MIMNVALNTPKIEKIVAIGEHIDEEFWTDVVEGKGQEFVFAIPQKLEGTPFTGVYLRMSVGCCSRVFFKTASTVSEPVSPNNFVFVCFKFGFYFIQFIHLWNVYFMYILVY